MIKRIGVFLFTSLWLLASSPVFAQPGPNPDFRGPMWGQGHMWGGGWGGGWAGGPHMILGPFMMLLALIGIVALILWLVRAFSHRGHGLAGCPHCGHGAGPGHNALSILAERFARGEIDKAEFEDKKRLIGR